MEKCILIIGVRRKCYEAAIELGYKVVLWSDGRLGEKRKKFLEGWIEESYSENVKELGQELKTELGKYQIVRVISNTEETVILGARVREYLKLKRLAVDVTQRFHNKAVMKTFASELNLPITKFKLIDQHTKVEDLVEYLGFPLVIKPVDESGAQDVKVAKCSEDVEKYMKPGLMAEAFVKGSEVSVETFVQDGRPILHNITEYLHQWKKSAVPASLESKLQSEIIELNDKIIERFGVDRGMTHAEFYLTDSGPVFGEIAIRPPGGYYMDLIEKVYGFNSWQLYVSLSCGKKSLSFHKEAKGHAAVYMIHPGAGKIISISGVDEIKEKVKGIFDFTLRRKIGDVILPHENTSNEVGHILFWSAGRKELDAELEYIESTLKFEFES